MKEMSEQTTYHEMLQQISQTKTWQRSDQCSCFVLWRSL